MSAMYYWFVRGQASYSLKTKLSWKEIKLCTHPEPQAARKHALNQLCIEWRLQNEKEKHNMVCYAVSGLLSSLCFQS